MGKLLAIFIIPLAFSFLSFADFVSADNIAPHITLVSPSSGKPGDDVSLKYENFYCDKDANRITFNGEPYLVESANLLSEKDEDGEEVSRCQVWFKVPEITADAYQVGIKVSKDGAWLESDNTVDFTVQETNPPILRIAPLSAAKKYNESQQFTAWYKEWNTTSKAYNTETNVTQTAEWGLDHYTLAEVVNKGLVKCTGKNGGDVLVTAQKHGLTAHASLTCAEKVAVGTEPATCTDTDSGKNYDVKGTCTDANRSYEDGCSQNNFVEDYYCNDKNNCEVDWFDCAANKCVCQDGKRVYPSATPITSGQGEEVSPPVLQNPYNYREYLDTSSATFVWSSIWGVENAIYNLIIEDHFGNEVKNIERTGSSDILALNEATFSLNNFVTENNKLTLEESPKGTYFWWYVRLKDSKNHKWSEWSEIRMFFIKEAVSGSPPPGGTTPSPGGYSAGVFTLQNPLKYDNFVDLVNAIIVFSLQVSIPLATIMFVISGVMFVTSAGEPTKITKARQIALYTAIGFAVVLSAAGLIKVLQSVLGTQNI